MNKQNIITITLIITGLALNPLMAEEVQYTFSKQKTINQSVTSSIVKILHKRGLDEDVADTMAANFVSNEDEILFQASGILIEFNCIDNTFVNDSDNSTLKLLV